MNFQDFDFTDTGYSCIPRITCSELFQPPVSSMMSYSHNKASTWYADDLDIIHDDSGNESLTEFEPMEFAPDPSCLVVPLSAKAHSGVSKYKDFIRNLPIHIAKMILGMLDQVSFLLHDMMLYTRDTLKSSVELSAEHDERTKTI